MTNHPDDATARHAAALYPDMDSPAPLDAPVRTTAPPAGTAIRGSTSRLNAPVSDATERCARSLYPDMTEDQKPPTRTASAMPWNRMHGHSMARTAPSAPSPSPSPTTQQTRTAQQAPRTGSDFDAMFDGAHREADPPQLSVQQVVTEQQSAEAALYPEGGQPLDSAETYSREALGEGFDGVLAQARHDQDAAEETALAEGREQASALMAEWQVPGETARGIALELDGFNQRWIKGDLPTDEELDSSRQKTENALRKEWGSRYDANVELARRTYKEASKRLPWLTNLVEETGAGNSPELIRHFATVGLKNARNRPVSGRNRR